MKILHTSDWHLGKRLEGKSRLLEQRRALEELVGLCESRKIDVVLVAGDIFDTANPPAEAEELFYRYALRLSEGRYFVAIAGNHDNAERLSAPAEIAAACNIILAGGMDNRAYNRVSDSGGVTGGEGWIKIERGGEVLNLALLPYPSGARMSAIGYKPEFGEYVKNVTGWLGKCAEGFGSGYNVVCSHLFMQNVIRSDEYELGTAAILPLNVLPKADYTALGHIHKPQKLSGRDNVYYSGGLLNFSFDEIGERYFNVVEITDSMDGRVVSVERVPIKSGKKPLKVAVSDYEGAVAALDLNADCWVQVLYDNALPLTAEKMSGLKGYENFCNLINVHRAAKAGLRTNAQKTDKELFIEYFKQISGEEPSGALIEMFLKEV